MHLTVEQNTTARPASENPKNETVSEVLMTIIDIHQALDSSISGASFLVTNPLAYLTSPDLLIRWKSDLDSLLDHYLRGDFTPDVFEKRLQAILPGVENLERVRDAREKGGMVDGIWEAVDNRCRLLEEVFEELGRRLEECDRRT